MLGISAQGYYKHDYASNEADILSASIVLYCLYVRQKERLPKAGVSGFFRWAGKMSEYSVIFAK